MKMLKKSFPEFLSLCKIFGTAIFLLLGNPSEGVNLPGNFIVFSDVALSSPAVVDLNHANNPMPVAMDETAILFSFPVSAPAPAPEDVTVCEGGNATFIVTGGSSYKWDVSTDNGATWSPISGETTSSLIRNSVTYIMSGYKYRCTVDDVSGNPATLTVLRYPAAAGEITGINTVCQGDVNKSYSVPLIADADQYIWTFPTGVSIISGNGSKDITVNFSSTALSGYITVNGTNGGLCDGVTSQIYLTVNPLPIAAGPITGTSTVCQGQNTVSYSVDAITNATSYIWAYSGSGATINGTEKDITITFAANATAGNLTVKGHNDCGDGTISTIHSIAVNPLPDAASGISGPITVCQGTTASYSVDAITNATSYIWAYSGSGATINGTEKDITINFSSSATAGNLTVKGHNNCGDGTISAIHPIAVNPLPDAALGISGPITVCQGATESYSVPLITNATSYTWAYSGAGATINGITKDITITFSANATAGNLTVMGTNSCGNGSISANYPIAANSVPAAPGTITGTASVCQGQNAVSYSVSAITNASSYTWAYSGTGATISNGTTKSITINFAANASAGNLTVMGTNSCGNGSISANYPIAAKSVPVDAESITGQNSVYQGQNAVSYLVGVITNATSYTWAYTGTGVTISNGTTNSISISFAANASSGNLTVMGTNFCGNGTISANYLITVNPVTGDMLTVAAGPITGTPTVCQGQNAVSYSVGVITNATSYIWAYSGAGATINGTTKDITITFAANATSGNLTVKGHNDYGDGTISPDYPITVNPLPAAAGIITGLSPACEGQTGVSYIVGLISGAIGYTWTLPSGATIASGGNTNEILVDFSAGAMSGNITVAGTNACGSGVASPPFPVTVSTNPASAGNISGTPTVCQGQINVVYSVQTIPEATSYIWAYTGTGATINGTTNNITITFSANATSGNLTVMGTNSCGNGSISANYPITVNPLPVAAGTINGTPPVCQGQNTVSYSVPVITNASSYTWAYSGTGATISNGTTNSITINFAANATSGNLTVMGTNSCGNGSISAPYAVSVDLLPSAAGTIIGLTTVCGGKTGVIYSVPPISNATSGYVWTIPPGTAIISGMGTQSIIVNYSATATSGLITVHGTNLCGDGQSSSISVTVELQPLPASTIVGTSVVCQGQTGVTYSVPVIGNATSYDWTLPVGASIVAGANTSSIMVDYSSGASTGFITVQGTSACGSGTVSASYPVTVNISPVAAYQFSNNSCADEAVPFTDQSLENGGGNISSWQWNFGDPASGTNNISALRNPTHAFTSSGPHTVTLTITNSNNCPNTVSHTVDIYPLPVADFSNTSSCLGSAITFTDLSFANSLSIATRDWDFGDGTTHSSLPNPTHTYAVLGNYNVTLVVTNSNGCVDTITKPIQVIPPPIAAFYTSAENCAGAPVQFTDQSSTSFGYILKWTWDFGDGTNPVTINYTGPGNILHAYSLMGTYNATLTVETSDHCTSIISHSVTVTTGPTANYIYGVNLCFGLPVQFTDQSQTNGAGPLTMWQWNFDDPGSGTSNTSTQPNPSHTFAAAGIHLVTLKVTNINSCTNTISKQVEILNLLVANFSADTTCLGAATTFTDLSIPNTLPIASWDWDFGDGSAHSTVQNPTHTFAMGGTQLVTLTVANSNGCTHSVTRPVMVIVPPGAAFVTSAQTCAVSPIQFTDQSTASHGFINKWTWDFGDGTPPVVISYPGSSNVTHTYSAGGTYNTTLTIQTSDLCLSSISHQIIVTGAPLANYTFTDNLCLGKSVQFTDLSQTNGGGAISSWLWNFNDPTSGVSNTSNLQSPVHIFSIAGTHNVTLTTTNVNNCSGTITKQITVGTGPAVEFIITSGTCIGSDVSFKADPTKMDPASITSINSYLWNFGDGGSSTLSEPTHVYNVAGTFQVTMSVVYGNGCTNSISRPVTIGAPPVPAFNYTSACFGNATKFTDYSYTGSGEPIVSWLWKFNDTNGDTSTLQYPVFKYPAQGTYNVTLKVTSLSGCKDSITIPVQVLAAPKANFNFITNTCANGNVSFQDSSISYMSAITEWKWEFEPGYVSTLKNPNHSFSYTDRCDTVKLTVTDMRGCVNTKAKEVCVPAGLEVEIEDPLACFGVDTWFKPKAPAGDSLIAFQWNFGDIASGSYNTSNLRNPFHHFQTPGSYSVSLTATDINNCSKTVYRQVDIQELRVPFFSYTVADCDNVVHFNASPTGGGVGIKSWIWNFGDGKSKTINDPDSANTSYKYASSGIYYVTMTVINRSDCSASFSDSLLVKPCLDAIFTQVDMLGCQNQAITFADNSTSSIPLTEWFWDFGDGSDSTYNAYQDTITHIFDTSGTFNVKLVISAQIAGKTVSDSDSLKVLINPSPIAGYITKDIAGDTTKGICLGLPAKFINASSGNGSQISSFAWDFGDPGTLDTSSLKNPPDYRYNQPGDFDVKLIATNPFGCSDTITSKLTIHPLPIADFRFSYSCAGFPTHFTDISDTVNAALIKWQWVFMDTILIRHDTLQNPDYLFATKGNHRVQLTITDKNGCQDTVLKPVVTYPVTVSAFEIMEDYENIQGRIHLINKTLNAPGYEWDFGNGTTSTEKEPTITYDPGDIYKINTYKIKLISYIYSQCADTLEKDYTLLLKGLYVPNAFSPTNPVAEVRLFKPVGMNIETYLVEVYDSWGKLIWSSTKLDANGSPEEGWNGTSPNGNLLPQDVYVWRITAVFRDGTAWNSKNAGNHTNIPEKTYGTVTLLR